MEIGREDLERLIRSDERGRIFMSIVLAAINEGADYACMDTAIVKTALCAAYPEAYEAEMQRRHAVRTPLVEIRTEGSDDV